MIKAYENKGQTLDLNIVLKEIDDNVSDPMIKSFIKMELKSKFKNKKKLWHPVHSEDFYCLIYEATEMLFLSDRKWKLKTEL